MEDKNLKATVLCGGRSARATYEKFISIYAHAKINGFTKVDVNFIEPNQNINEIKKYIENMLDFYENLESDYYRGFKDSLKMVLRKIESMEKE